MGEEDVHDNFFFFYYTYSMNFGCKRYIRKQRLECVIDITTSRSPKEVVEEM